MVFTITNRYFKPHIKIKQFTRKISAAMMVVWYVDHSVGAHTLYILVWQ